MTDREKAIVRMALIYLQANLSDACDAFVADEEGDNWDGNVSINGDEMPAPTEEEIEQCLKLVQ